MEGLISGDLLRALVGFGGCRRMVSCALSHYSSSGAEVGGLIGTLGEL
jgi:hypothetical protein